MRTALLCSARCMLSKGAHRNSSHAPNHLLRSNIAYLFAPVALFKRLETLLHILMTYVGDPDNVNSVVHTELSEYSFK